MAKNHSLVHKVRAAEAGAALTESLVLLGFVLCGAVAIIGSVAGGSPAGLLGLAGAIAGTPTI